ncbi:hypothetical protein [uncultured Clostridium sp.]|uniref:hypothetical protein n=1 Tax=uncultured Clostridium sp. TaxID=59620 RepID=UPI002587B37D|nr:hypothetical protein [uncultured Clostridium sp.]
MNFNGWDNLEDLFRACGYTNCSENENNQGCSDIPNGFQTLPPELFVLIAELLGNIIAGKIPFNIQNVIGNWFELLGQVILTFNAQQQYFQSGPGRYYDPKNYNVTNPFCSNNTNNSSSNQSSTSNTSNTTKTKDTKKIRDLENQVQELTKEINEIKMLLQKK